SFKLIVLLGGMVLVTAWQWRTILQLRQEKREFQRSQASAEQKTAELSGLAQTMTEREQEVQSLRVDSSRLRSEVDRLAQQLAQCQRATNQLALRQLLSKA